MPDKAQERQARLRALVATIEAAGQAGGRWDVLVNAAMRKWNVTRRTATQDLDDVTASYRYAVSRYGIVRITDTGRRFLQAKPVLEEVSGDAE